MAKARRVRIENSTGNGSTSVAHATRYVALGRAVWTGPLRIRFLETDRTHQSLFRLSQEQYTGRNYDQVAHRTKPTFQILRELKNTPVISPMKLLAPVGRLKPSLKIGRLRKRVVMLEGVLQ